MTTRYRPRTEVERWQIQDRLSLRLRQLGCGNVRFFEAASGKLGFRVRAGWRPPPALLQALEAVDSLPPDAGSPDAGSSNAG
ncbi:MAG: hypothetical protein HY355_00415 [Armatimonadetes bacterium]|nr:hypothetical protein [Armatimonadota bacterium]